MARRLVRRSAVVLALVAALAAGACSGSGYHYVTSKKTGVYLRVPSEWRVFNHDALAAGLKQNGSPLDSETLFIAGFDSAPKPSIDRVAPLDPGSDHPTGLVRVKALTGEERDVVSFQALRNLLLPVDQGVQDNKMKLLGHADLAPKGGLRGQRYIYQVVKDDGGSFIVDQTALVDAKTERLFMLAVACETECYANNRKTVDKVVTSWTVTKG
jgi:hypothetical protein